MSLENQRETAVEGKMAQSFETEKRFAVFLTVKRHTRRPAEVRKA